MDRRPVLGRANIFPGPMLGQIALWAPPTTKGPMLIEQGVLNKASCEGLALLHLLIPVCHRTPLSREHPWLLFTVISIPFASARPRDHQQLGISRSWIAWHYIAYHVACRSVSVDAWRGRLISA